MDKIKTLTLADAIRIAIVHSGLTLEEVGDALGVDPKTVGRWQLGRNVPRFDHLVKLADLTGYDVAFFAEVVNTKAVRTLAGVCSGQVELDLTGDSPRVVVPPPFVHRRLLAA